MNCGLSDLETDGIPMCHHCNFVSERFRFFDWMRKTSYCAKNNNSKMITGKPSLTKPKNLGNSATHKKVHVIFKKNYGM